MEINRFEFFATLLGGQGQRLTIILGSMESTQWTKVQLTMWSTVFFSSGVMAEVLRANIGSKLAISFQRGPVDPKFQVEKVAPTNHSSSHKSRLNGLSYGIKIWTDLSSVLLQFTCLTDGRTDRDSFLITRPRLHSMLCGKNRVLLYSNFYGKYRKTDR